MINILMKESNERSYPDDEGLIIGVTIKRVMQSFKSSDVMLCVGWCSDLSFASFNKNSIVQKIRRNSNKMKVVLEKSLKQVMSVPPIS